MGATTPFWQHRCNDVLSDFYQSPSNLLNHYDKYYEDFYIGKKSPSPFMLRTAGFRYCHPTYHLSNMNHGERYAMLFIIAGKGYSNGMSLQRGDVVFFHRNRLCNFSSDFDNPCIYAWLTFKGGNIEALLERIGMSPDNFVYQTNNIVEISSLFYDMLYVEHNDCNVEMYMESQFIKILSLAENKNSKTVSVLNPSKENYINQAFQYLAEHFRDSNFCIADISSAVGISENYLRTLFRKKMGISIQEYIIEQRINIAKTLLNNSNYNVSEITEFCGYSDYRHFSKQFKKRVGVSPSKYKNGGK